MNHFQKIVLPRVFGAHMGVLILMLLIPWLKGCFHPKPKTITFVDLASMPPPPPPEIAPEPIPEPKKAEPIKKTPPPATNAPPTPKAVKVKKPEPKTERPKKPEPKPKTQEEIYAGIRAAGKPVKAPASPSAKPALDFSGIKSALSNASGSGYGSGSGSGAYSPFAWYYALVQQKMYQAWQQPSSAPKGLAAEATIRIERDGTVISKSITRRSGNAAFDQSIQNALAATASLPAPPADLPDRTISIEFVLKD